MRIDVLTLFPDILTGFLSGSIVKRALETGVVDVRLHNFRRFSEDRHHSVDDAPFGGGPGMVLMPDPIFKAVAHVREDCGAVSPLLYLSPKGETFDQSLARELAAWPSVILLCGRYEGVDQRVVDHLVDREISIGDYVLSGGEVAAMALMDAVIRLLPGALGDVASSEEESFSPRFLEYPQYTRPADYLGWRVPEVLLSGNHEAIRRWRREMALSETRKKRPDLIEGTEVRT
jgi:tRNA (guanine37-N1)-methyltransferase